MTLWKKSPTEWAWAGQRASAPHKPVNRPGQASPKKRWKAAKARRLIWPDTQTVLEQRRIEYSSLHKTFANNLTKAPPDTWDSPSPGQKQTHQVHQEQTEGLDIIRTHTLWSRGFYSRTWGWGLLPPPETHRHKSSPSTYSRGDGESWFLSDLLITSLVWTEPEESLKNITQDSPPNQQLVWS